MNTSFKKYKQRNITDQVIVKITISRRIRPSITHCFSDEHVLLNCVSTQKERCHVAREEHAFYAFGTPLNWTRQF